MLSTALGRHLDAAATSNNAKRSKQRIPDMQGNAATRRGQEYPITSANLRTSFSSLETDSLF